MENVLFKISYPAEFHAQTAVACALKLHPLLKNKLYRIKRIDVRTQEAGIRIISKKGPLNNPADRDHSLEYMVAVPLIYGELTAAHYEDTIAKNPLIDQLREKMITVEDKTFSRDYLDPEKRSIANSIQIFFKDGSSTEKVTVEYPIGHRKRREESIPLLYQKFESNLSKHYQGEQLRAIVQLFKDQKKIENTPVHELMDLFANTL